MTRLETLAPELVAKLRTASTSDRRAAALAAARFALSETQFHHPLIDQALASLRTANVLTAEQRKRIDALSAKLDEEYLDLQDATEEGRADAADYLRKFGQARAVAAVSFAGDEDAFKAATEAIYEAGGASDEPQKLFAIIQDIFK